MKKKWLSWQFILVPLSYYYVGPIVFIAYFYSVKSLFSKLSIKTIICVLHVVLMLVILIAKEGSFNGLMLTRYYWGWIAFYIFFSLGYRFNRENLLNILSLLVIAEAFAINTFTSALHMPNYPTGDDVHGHLVQTGYQRPYSFGGSASVTSAIIVSLLASLRLKLRKTLFPVIAVFICASGTGFLTLFLYFLYKYWNKFLALLILPTVALLFFSNFRFSHKLSFDYFRHLYEFKLFQISEVKFSNGVELLSGYNLSDTGGMGGGFSASNFLRTEWCYWSTHIFLYSFC